MHRSTMGAATCRGKTTCTRPSSNWRKGSPSETIDCFGSLPKQKQRYAASKESMLGARIPVEDFDASTEVLRSAVGIWMAHVDVAYGKFPA